MPTESISAQTSGPGRPPAAGGVIHDLGYQRYDGPRLARQRIVAALAWHSFRSAFGFGRGVKAKAVPVIVMIVICLPAVVNAFAMSRGNTRLVDYDTYAPVLRDLTMTVFLAVQAPELVSRDLRSRVLPLYFSRPVKPGDYPLAKYLGFTAACLVVLEAPLLLLYAGSVVNVHGGAAVLAQTRALIPGLLLGVMWAVSLAAVSLFLASLSARRGLATGAVAIAFLLTYTLAQILLQVETQAAANAGPRGPGGEPLVTLGQKVAGLFSPYTLFDGVRRWLGGTNAGDQVPAVGGFGAAYALVLVVIVALSLYGLAARYRRARLS
jgi:ABC-2 type transport system permease protein